jgi:DNA-binding NtrC family response regulator
MSLAVRESIESRSVPCRASKKGSEGEWFWGLGPALAGVRNGLELASKREVPVLVIGETGTGKEVIARALHERRLAALALNPVECPFLPINMAALPESLVESILFGHERGAFTSARERQLGKFELARKGTLFLDEVQSLSLSTQAKLLRVLQSREIERLGARQSQRAECQVVVASNVPLEILVREGRFRRDLYYRLNACPLFLPALRQRREDFPVLIKGLLARLNRVHGIRSPDIDPQAYEALLLHDWPGNLRELEHALLYACLRCEDSIEVKHLPPQVTGRLETYLSEGNWK